MNKIKYIAALLIAITGLGLQQVKACESTLNVANAQLGGGTGNFGTVAWSLSGQTATFTFTASSGYFFVDGQIADLQINSSNFSVDVSGMSGFTANIGSSNAVDGFGRFNLQIDSHDASNQWTTITFTVTNLSSTLWTSCDDVLIFNQKGYDAAAHVFATSSGLTGFVGENGAGVPDGGATVMLLGAGLGALGMARRFFLKS